MMSREEGCHCTLLGGNPILEDEKHCESYVWGVYGNSEPRCES